jgi:hypothetical protein
MKSRWIIITILGLAIAALVGFIAQNSYWDEISVPMPLRGEAVTNPFYAAQRFSEALGATTEWRRTLGELPNDDAVVVLSHWHWDLIQDRRQQVEEWVNAGGRLVIDRTLIGGEDHLETWAGIRRAYPDEEEDEDQVEADDDNDASELTPDGDTCGRVKPVDRGGTVREDGRELSVCKLDGFSYLATDRDIAWGFANDDGLQMVRVKVGRGSVTSINADPFGNRDLLEIDHGVLFAAATQVRRNDRVIFISERDHTSLLGLIWMHGAPVVVLFLIVLAALLWRGGIRFGPLSAATENARRSIAEQIRGTGQFTIRLGGGKALHAATVRALHEAASRRLAGYSGSAHPDRIAAIAHATGIDAETLEHAINHGGARRPAELAQTIATLEAARRKILGNAA